MGTVRQYLQPEEAETLSSAFAQFTKADGTNFPVSGLAYDATTTETAMWKWTPFGYGSGDVTVDIIWYAATATSGTVDWGAGMAAITPNTDTQDVTTKSWGTTQIVTDTHLGTTGKRLHLVTVTITSTDFVAAGDECWLRVLRNGAADDMAGDAILTSVRLSYSDT